METHLHDSDAKVTIEIQRACGAIPPERIQG
jgi:hypothetical protein